MSNILYIQHEWAYTIAIVIAASIVSAIVFFNFGVNHTTLLHSSAKRAIESTLKQLMKIDESAKKGIESILQKLSSEEQSYLKDTLDNLTDSQYQLLLNNNHFDLNTFAPKPPTVKFMFFEHQAHYACSIRLDKAKTAYDTELNDFTYNGLKHRYINSCGDKTKEM
ncbi:MAG: hypothetical protein V4496_07530 [Pseudomonadota bacterium]